MDVLVRIPALLEGRLLSVSSIPMSEEADGIHYAVTDLDVTAERRHRDELASFADVAAHHRGVQVQRTWLSCNSGL